MLSTFGGLVARPHPSKQERKRTGRMPMLLVGWPVAAFGGAGFAGEIFIRRR